MRTCQADSLCQFYLILLFTVVSPSLTAQLVWQNELSQGSSLTAIWGSAPNDVFVAGEYGSMLHYDGQNWQPMATQTTTLLTGIWGTEAQNVFAVGWDGSVHHYTGSQWKQINKGEFKWLIDIWGYSAQEVFAASVDGRIIHYDGQQWNELFQAPATLLSSLWGASATELFAVGWNGNIIHYEGQQWSLMDSGTEAWLKGIWGRSSSDIFAVGDQVILHYDGQSWQDITPADAIGFNDVWGTAETVFAIGDNRVFQYEGQRWQKMPRVSGDELMAIWGHSEQSVFAVGDLSTIIHYEGQRWQLLMNHDNNNFFHGVWGSSKRHVFAVGNGIMRYNGNRWRWVNSSTLMTLKDIWGNHRNDIFAVGDFGSIVHYDGFRWLPMKSHTSQHLRGVWAPGNNTAFAVGSNGTILHYDGQQWQLMPTDTSAQLQAIWGRSEQDVFAVGETILHYNGQQWVEVMDQLDWGLNAIWGPPNQDIFIASEGGIFHYDGQQWHLMTEDPGIVSLDGRSSQDIFALHHTGQIHHYDGQQWQSELSEPHVVFADVWADDTSEEVFAVGNSIFHKKPPEYTLTLMVQGQGMVQGEDIACDAYCSQTFPAGHIIELMVSAQAEFRFSGWEGPGCGQIIIMTQDLECIAVFEPLTLEPSPQRYYQLTLQVEGQGRISHQDSETDCTQSCVQEYPLGQLIRLTAIAAEDALFQSWQPSDCGSSFVLTADKTCTARFRSAITPTPLEEQSYVLTVQRQGQGTVRSTPNGIECGQLCRYEFPSTQAVHLTAHAAGGFIFAGWHPQDCAQPLTLTAPLTCTAVFEAQISESSPTPEVPIVEETPSVSVEEYPLMVGIKGKGSIQITPPGLSCQQQCRQSYAEGTVVTLTALAEIDTVFSGWQGDCEGQQPSLTQTLNAARTCEAVFQPLGQPVISLSPMRYDFGAIWIGNTAQQKFILHNLGQQPLEVAEIQLTAPEFILTQSCNNKRLAPEAQCPLTVAFQPQAEGQHRATLLIHSNDPQTQRLIVSLNGEGYIAQPETPLCPPSGWINSVCDNRGQTITDATLGPQASVAGGQFAGDIRSQGLVSLVTIQAGAQLTGGKLTGYILNEGTLADFEFVGAILSGGTLAGHIINSSQVGGRFENVHLAANTYIRGGQLQGEIIGTAGAPALLEYLTISAGSYLNHVILGEGVMLMEAVNLGEQVTVTASSTLIEPAESESSLPLEHDLPLLGNSVALAPQAESMTSKAQFNGGISVNFGDFHPQTTARLADFIDIRGILTVDPEHINRLADIVVYAVYQPDADAESSFAYMLNAQGQIVPWDRDLNSLTAFIEQTVLTPRHTIQMYSNQFHLPGVLTINFGYRLYQGPLMTHETPIKVIVTP